MNGKHELRLERIEDSLGELHEKMDTLVEQGAVHRTEITWLKWGMRALAMIILGGGAALGVPSLL